MHCVITMPPDHCDGLKAAHFAALIICFVDQFMIMNNLKSKVLCFKVKTPGGTVVIALNVKEFENTSFKRVLVYFIGKPLRIILSD